MSGIPKDKNTNAENEMVYFIANLIGFKKNSIIG